MILQHACMPNILYNIVDHILGKRIQHLLFVDVDISVLAELHVSMNWSQQHWKTKMCCNIKILELNHLFRDVKENLAYPNGYCRIYLLIFAMIPARNFCRFFGFIMQSKMNYDYQYLPLGWQGF